MFYLQNKNKKQKQFAQEKQKQKEKQKEKNEKLSFAEDGNKAYEILGVAGFEPTYP